MWREIIQNIGKEYTLSQPVNQELQKEMMNKIGHSIPEEIESLLLETNGVIGEYAVSVVWPIERIIRNNEDFQNDINFQELYMAFDSCFFFADAGNGDQFFYRMNNGKVVGPDVYIWNHEDDSRNWFARDLEEYLKKCHEGVI